MQSLAQLCSTCQQTKAILKQQEELANRERWEQGNREREAEQTEREIAESFTPCNYCGSLMHNSASICASCGAEYWYEDVKTYAGKANFENILIWTMGTTAGFGLLFMFPIGGIYWAMYGFPTTGFVVATTVPALLYFIYMSVFQKDKEQYISERQRFSKRS